MRGSPSIRASFRHDLLLCAEGGDHLHLSWRQCSSARARLKGALSAPWLAAAPRLSMLARQRHSSVEWGSS
eukprot:7754812-Alexandrium_andersonii.AAC.1